MFPSVNEEPRKGKEANKQVFDGFDGTRSISRHHLLTSELKSGYVKVGDINWTFSFNLA